MDKPFIPFHAPDKTIRRYTLGDCGALAYVLYLIYDLEIYGICLNEKLKDVHFVVKFNNHYIDIRGIWTEEALLNDMLKQQMTNDHVYEDLRRRNEYFMNYLPHNKCYPDNLFYGDYDDVVKSAKKKVSKYVEPYLKVFQ